MSAEKELACKKCATPMEPTPKITGPFAGATFTVTGFRCLKCGHWNNLKRRKARTPKKDLP